MAFSFVKYHGAGNDFILINGFDCPDLDWTRDQRAAICRRHYGVGADGIIVIKASSTRSFEMMYYNADGRLGSLCGNGSRCALAFAEEIGVIAKDEWVSYTAFGGDYRGRVNSQDDIRIEVPVHQAVVKSLGDNQFFVDTGSPHLIILKKPDQNWIQEAYQYRWDERFKSEGCNVNYLWKESTSTSQEMWHISTYERGVEAPTEACGTGNIAAFLVLHNQGVISVDENLSIQNAGGVLSTCYDEKTISDEWKRVILSGPAQKTFEGSVKFQ